MRTALFFLLMASLLAGCADELTPVSRIERARVLGARVDIDGDATRATPNAGETATVSWIVATPDGEPADLAWAFVACTERGCHDQPFATGGGSGAAPSLEMTVPADASGPLWIAGVVCERGTPAYEPGATLPTCTGDDAIATPVELEIDVATGNHHPTAGAFAVGGATWTGTTCDDAPALHATKSIEIVWIASDDREAFAGVDGTPTREALVLAAFATAGEMDDHFAAIEATDDDLERTLTWKPPVADEIPADGLPVHFTFVVRDGRGGIAATTRTLCLTR